MKKVFVSIAIIAAAISCGQKEEGFVPSESQLVPHSFRAVGEVTSKTSLSGRSVIWSTTDEIDVFSGDDFTTRSKFTVSSVQDGGKIAVFDGLATLSTEYYAVFPQVDENECSDAGVITATIPAAQEAVAGSFGPEANLAVAHITGTEDVQFKNVGALLAVTIGDANVTGLKVESLDHTPMTGTAEIDYNGGEPVVTGMSDSHDYVETAVSGTGTYYFVVYPGNYSGGFQITLSRPGYTASVKNTKALNLGRNDNVNLMDIPSVPSDAWKVVFTPGEKVYIKGIADANENGQQMSYITADYYAPHSGYSAPGNTGDDTSFAGITYNYEVWAKIDETDNIYFESENGARFGLNIAADAVAAIAPDAVGNAVSVSNSPYRIRVNLPSGDAQIVRVAIVNYGILFGGDGTSVNLNYDQAGAWKVDDYTFTYQWQSWDNTCVRYRFRLWFNWKGGKGGSGIDVWHTYGSCNALNNSWEAPSTEDPANYYYYVQPFNNPDGNAWDPVYYLDRDRMFVNSSGYVNQSRKGTISLYMNNTYGHFTHGFSNIVDKN